jgi:hypothetical protein
LPKRPIPMNPICLRTVFPGPIWARFGANSRQMEARLNHQIRWEAILGS